MSAELTFTVLPDTHGARTAALALCAVPGVRVIPHASGRPWLVGHWPTGAVRVAGAGRARVAVAGFCPVTARRLDAMAAELRDLAEPADLARRLHGSAHLIASVGGRVRVHGTASGVRAVFHTLFGGVTVAADRPDTLAALTGADIDEDLLAARLLAPGVPHPLRERPLWQGVAQVPPDHCLQLEPDGTATTARWWSPPEPAPTRAQGTAAVREALTEAVFGRVGAGDVVSAELSGGTAQGAVAHLAARARPHLITVRTPQFGPGGDDAVWTDRSAALLPDAEHVVTAYENAPTLFARLGGRTEGTVLASEPPYRVRSAARFADAGRTVAARGSRLHLCGHGGDELFPAPAAPAPTVTGPRPDVWHPLVRARRALARGPLAAPGRALAGSRTFPAWLARSAERLGAPPPSPGRAALGWTPPLRMPAWATAEAAGAVRGLLLDAAGRRPEPLAAGCGAHAVLDSVRRAGAAVRYAERLMAAHGVHVAAPYLDDRVVEAALAVRLTERTAGGRRAPLLAEAMRGLVPDDLLGRGAGGSYGYGYGEDVHDGMRRNLGALLGLFDGSELARRGLVDDAAVQAGLRAAHVTDAPPAFLTALEPTLACEVWLRSLTDGARPPGAHPLTTTEGSP
ncbi:asparagine synthase-related protein [Streptomyces sp. NPDC002004]